LGVPYALLGDRPPAGQLSGWPSVVEMDTSGRTGTWRTPFAVPNVGIIGRVWGEMRECRLPRAWDHLSPGGSCHEDGTTFLPGEARFVVGFGAVVITAVIVFGQNTTFLDAYDSAAGQLVVGRRRPAAAYPAPAAAAEVTIVGLAYQLATVEVPAGPRCTSPTPASRCAR